MPMPYVRRRGAHLAIVHGSRHPETKKVEQQVLMTLHSKAEALAALGRTSEKRGWSFRQWMEHRYPEIRFNWPKLEKAIEEQMDDLPDIAKSREERATGGFDTALAAFTRHVLESDPQTLDSAREAIEKNRAVLQWLVDLVDWRLEASARTEPSEWSRDPFGWRLALGSGTMDPELEEGVANRMHDGREDEAEAIFLFLVKLYENYAEGWNYLGLISLERGDFAEALERFETCQRVGRKLFPRRIPKRDYWSRLETRPYMRGLMNQCIALGLMGRYAKALRLAERLEHECGDDIMAAVYRAAIFLNTGEWRLAYDAALHTANLYPTESLVAAFAAFELGELEEARARFRHATLNHPRGVGIVLGKRTPEPANTTEARDHNAGVTLVRSLSGYLSKRSTKTKRFFTGLWDDQEISSLREEIMGAERTMDGMRGPDYDQKEYRRLFDRLHSLRKREPVRA